MAARDLNKKQAEYAAVMGDRSPRSAVVATADPFAEYSLTDFADEIEILEEAGKMWGRKFVPARGFNGKRGGGAWVSHNGSAPVAVVHPEKFMGKSSEGGFVNFWWDYLKDGQLYAHLLGVPFHVVVKFNDGLFVVTLPEKMEPTVGTRIRKRPGYEQCYNLIVTVPMESLKRIASYGDNKAV